VVPECDFESLQGENPRNEQDAVHSPVLLDPGLHSRQVDAETWVVRWLIGRHRRPHLGWPASNSRMALDPDYACADARARPAK
jgi:hypothetical protein